MKRLLALMALVTAGAAWADDPLPPAGDKALDFSLRFAHTTTDFYYDGSPVNTTVKWIGVSWREPLGARLYLGAFGGYSFLTQTNNALLAGAEADGYHAGVALHLVVYRGERLTLFATAGTVYQNVEFQGVTQTVELEWYQPGAELGGALALGGGVRVYGGGNYGFVSGQERAHGTIERTTNFERDARGGGFVGLDLDVDRDGYVGFETRTGVNRGSTIYFKRLF